MEKYGYPPVHTPIRERRQAFPSSTRSSLKYICLFTALFFLALWHLGLRTANTPQIIVDDFPQQKPSSASKPATETGKGSSHAELNDGTWKVPLEAHIMSKCPDALDCLQQLLVPAMSYTSSKVNFTLSYIGTPTADGVSCMHGPTECLGNILELCAADTYPDPKIYLGFTLCLSKRYSEIPSRDLIEDCSMEHGIDFAKLNECASREDGEYGMRLLRESVERSRNVGAGISCTVRLDDEVRCVRDGGQWKQCPNGSAPGDLVKDIERLYSEGNDGKKR